MMLQTGSYHCFSFLLLFMLHLSPTLAYFLKGCTAHYSDNDNDTAGVSVLCSAFDLARIPDNIPRDVVSLTIYGNIQRILRIDFYHLSNLTYLGILSGELTHVDGGAFVPLVELKELQMDDNKLTTLTDNMFQGLSNLLVLSLDGNNIQFINPAAFESLISLQELRMMCNQMKDIITVLQLPLPSLQVLSINIDELESFQSKDLPLNVSSEVRELKVISKSIKQFSITTGVFPHLKTIDLSLCCNGTGWEWDIPDKYFLNNISELYLIVTIVSFNTTKKALQSLDSLEYLKLESKGVWMDRDLLNIVCNITTLRTLILHGGINANLSKTLSHCTELINLELGDNGLTELSKDSIKQMNQLSQLNLASNQLSKVPDDVKNLSVLQILDLSYNSIRDLSCSDFLNLTRLTHLHLDRNHIYELKQCVFQNLNELKVLTLYYNSIETYGDTFKTGLQKLETLGLTNNKIQQLSEGEFMSLKSLKHLDIELDYTEWNPSDTNYFEGLDELETLGLYINDNLFKITSSPPCELQWKNNNTISMNSLKSLSITFASPYYIQNMSGMLSDMKALEHLKMNGVHLRTQDSDSYKYVSQLKSLSLRSCKLTSLDFLTKADLTRLSLLDLRQNELTVINVSVFSFLPALRFIQMDKNPLACDCSNADFLQWMQNNNQTLVVDAHLYTCGFPLDKKGTRFLDFDIHSCWIDASFICYISSTCVIVLTLLTSFTYHFLHLHLLYGYYLFLAFLYDAKERKRGSPQRYDAFISYNVHDELWVYREMLPVLEGEQGWKLCLHHRDFPPGKPIIENITDAIYGSRKIICVISHHYLESEWCSREIQMASYRLFDEQKDVLILVFLEDIPAHQLSPYYHMKRLVKRHTYLSWSQAGQHPGLFWQNLRRALDTPHSDLGLNE